MLVPFLIQAQDMVDALRYSNVQVSGTARSGGMGNAYGALGGDFTSVSINPAGLGLYRSAEFTFTPKLSYSTIEGNYMNTTMEDNKYSFALNNISYVGTIPTLNRSEVGLVSINLGIGYNRLKDFNSNFLAGASGVTSSFLDDLIENANGEDANAGWSDFYEELAYYNTDTNSGADLMYYDEELGYWVSDIEINPENPENVENYPVSQLKSISKTGSIDEYLFAVGLNFNHKLYLGATLGITDIYYKETSTYEEWDANGDIPNFESMEFDSYLKTTGTGYNFKIGLIYKPINEVRLGVSLHTPTFYDIRDAFHTSMYSRNNFDGSIVNDEGHSSYNNYDYNLDSPLRATFSGAFVIAKKGILSIDYEYVDYSNMKLRKGGDGYNFTTENQEISEAFRSVGNIRVGGELRANNALSLRAGFEYYPSAYKSESFDNVQFKSDDKLMTYSAGLGYRFSNFTFDIAYRLTDNQEYELPYSAPSTSYYPQPDAIEFNTMKHDVIFSLGFRF